MDIGIIGTGHMADALGRQWLRAGHRLTVAGRDERRATALCERLGGGANPTRLAALPESVGTVLLAVRRTGVLNTLRAAGAEDGALQGRVVIDCSNPIDEVDDFRLVTAGGPSMAERIAELAVGAEVAKAFNLCSADLWRMTPPASATGPVTVPLCGATRRAREVVTALIEDIGCRALDLGALDRAGQLEAVAAFGIRLIVAGSSFDAVMPTVQPGPPPGHGTIDVGVSSAVRRAGP